MKGLVCSSCCPGLAATTLQVFVLPPICHRPIDQAAATPLPGLIHLQRCHCGLQDKRRRTAWERTLVQFQCRMFVASWTGVVRYHGPRPVNRPNNVWVCNHTSMIDYIILTSYSPFAVIMQLHAGWIAFLQTRVLSCLGCLWFNRNEVPILP